MDAFDALPSSNGLFSELFVPPAEPASLSTIQDVPEIALYRSIFERGIYDLFYHSKVDPGGAAKIRRDSKNWIMSNRTDDIMCFISLCDLFLIDPENLRKRLITMVEEGLVIKQREDQ